MDIAISWEVFFGVIGGLIGFIAVFYIDSVRREMNQLRDQNTSLGNSLAEVVGRLSETRENMVGRNEFNGAINRLYTKMSNVDKRMVLFLAELNAKKTNGRRLGD